MTATDIEQARQRQPANRGGGFDIQPQNLEEAERFCQMLAKSAMVPKPYQNRPQDIMVACTMGSELGLKPLQALQNIAVVNGTPSVYGDALMALVRAHPECEDIQETIERGDGKDPEQLRAVCTVKRRGMSPVTATFSVADAQKAGLWKKQGPWQQYPKRMLQLRARAFALRDAFADALRGIAVYEEVRDVPRDVTPHEPPANGIDALNADVSEPEEPEGEGALPGYDDMDAEFAKQPDADLDEPPYE